MAFINNLDITSTGTNLPVEGKVGYIKTLFKKLSAILGIILLAFCVILKPIRAEEETSPPVTEQVITTGDATTQTESQNQINSDPAPVTETPPVTETNNSADLTVSNTTDSTTGQNQSIGNSQADTNTTVATGNAESSIENQNQVNTNTVSAETTTPDLSSPSPENLTIVENNNQSQVSTTNSSTSDTGTNTVANSGDVTVDTGNATSSANIINLINTNSVSSNLGIYIINNFNDQWANLDLNQIWQKLLAGDGVTQIQAGQDGQKILLISNKNIASLNNQITVIANSGDNLVAGANEVLIVTGNATALANVVNLINTNLVNSHLFIGVINLSGENLGDIILPNPEQFQIVQVSDQNQLTPVNDNQASLNNQIKTSSNTGINSADNTDNSNIETGQAVSQSNELNAVNLNSDSNNQMLIQLNVLGVSTGKIYNLTSPGSVDDINSNQLLFYLSANNSSNNNPQDLVLDQNQADVNNNILVTADSGNNQILNSTSATIQTGNAWAIANLSNFINLNLLNSDWFWGIINIFGNWSGNIIFAYPDLTINLSANQNRGRSGDELVYSVNYQNLGYLASNDSTIEIALPPEITYLGDDSGLELIQTGNKLVWKIPYLQQRSTNNFNLRVRVNDTQTRTDLEVQILALVQTASTESDLNNNHSTLATVIWYPIETKNSDTDNRQAKISIDAKNNVNHYVLPNDTVTFQIKIRNTGESKMKDSVLVHQIYDENGNLWSEDKIYLGDINLNIEGLVDFGIIMQNAGGKYYTKTWIVGLNENNQEVTSNVSETSFIVKRYMVLKKGEVLAAEEINPDEYIYQTETKTTSKIEKISYLLLFLISFIYIQKQLSLWLIKRKP